ncbi:hypothetical protein B9Z55_011406 [Caenorhabditis nigoni]|uniref:Uncharacterized protein n=1 Tax=Caenorhabditis nigoni TaxID=1611254 RepID=A0A2G5UJY4_9PELO|nr:hypothetical protein B9Z55_011406 [Caenorhabditis nigoni]
MADGSRQEAAVEARSRPARSVKKERQVAVSPMNRRIRNTSNILNERDERPGGIMKDKSMVHSMAKTQPVSERQTVRLEDLTRPISIKNNAEIQAAVEIQNRLQKKMARNSERRRKMTHASETTAQNRTQERIDFVEFANKHYHVDYLQNGVR